MSFYARKLSHLLCTLILICIAGYDVVIGLRMLFSETPWLILGNDTLWANQAVSPAFEAAMRRIGAFSLLAGIMQIFWLVKGFRERNVLSALLIVQLCIGPAFFWIDQSWFQGTSYLSLKSAFGAAWSLALLLHLFSRRSIS